MRRARIRRGPGPRRSTPLRPDRTLTRRTPLRRTGFTAASPAQRGKVAPLGCLVCRGRPCDPAHLVPRRHGGCEQPDCVVPLCRTCHRAFDDGRLELLAGLEPGYRAELAHALGHVSLAWLVGRVTAGRWRPGAAASDGNEGRRAA
jgi:hypothetical protein